MRKIDLIPFLILGMVACNDGGSANGEATADTSAAATADTSHHHMADASSAVAPLPAIPDSAKVFFVNLKDGQKIKSPFTVKDRKSVV
jgi:hypothetical protein